MKDSTETIVYIVLGVVIALGINFGLGFLLHTPIPIVAVESNSMRTTTITDPFEAFLRAFSTESFEKGDILIIQGVPKENLTKGDVIVFSGSGPVPIVHRIVEINQDGTFQTKGDANAGQHPFEKSIPYENIYGKKIFKIPWLGWVKIGLIEFVLPNIIWVIAAIAVLIFIYFIKQYL